MLGSSGSSASIFASLKNSRVVNNTNIGATPAGGVEIAHGLVSNCTIVGNSASSGGGVVLTGDGLVQDCYIVSNSASGSGGGGYAWKGGTMRNCLVSGNVALEGGGIYLWGTPSTVTRLENCTVVGNYALSEGGGIYNYSDLGTGTVVNTIAYSNWCITTNGNWYANAGISTNRTYLNCCIAPTNDLPGTNNITNEPAFVDYNDYNFRQLSSSPCINAGLNLNWVTNAVDLDGRTRLQYGFVDIGCYEYVSKGIFVGSF